MYIFIQEKHSILTTHAYTVTAIPPSSTRKQLLAGFKPSFPAYHNVGKEDASFLSKDQAANQPAILGEHFQSDSCDAVSENSTNL